jgi:multidrug efflux pump subunit AcrA (membrane-fusion protein)
MRTTFAACRSMRLSVALLVGLTGCTDLTPLQARLDDLQARMEKLEMQSAKSASATTSAQAASAKADQTATQAMRSARANADAIASLEDKIDRMFKRPPSN